MTRPSLKKVILFDLDHTLLPIDSDFEWGQFTTRIGWTDPQVFAKQNEFFYLQYKEGRLDIPAYVRFATAAIRERGEVASLQARAQYMAQVILPAIEPSALNLVEQSKQVADALAIVTATNEFITQPIAQAFGVNELIAVQLEKLAQSTDAQSSPWITGEIVGVPSMREGKVIRVEQWLEQKGWTWQDVDLTFYSDSINDLPLLEKAQTAVATNPDDRLRAIAKDRNWQILDLFEKK